MSMLRLLEQAGCNLCKVGLHVEGYKNHSDKTGDNNSSIKPNDSKRYEKIKIKRT